MASVPVPPAQFPFSRADLRLLDAVAGCGDLAEVARRLGLRQGSVERRLDRLDKDVDLALTRRGCHSAQLTPAGSRLLVAGRRFFRQVDLAARTEIFGSGPEALDAPDVLSIASAEPLLEDVVEDASATLGVLLSISHDTPHGALRQLADFSVDAVHTWGLDTPHASVERAVRAYDVLDDALWVTLPSGHPLADRESLALADLLDENWVSEAGPGSEVLVERVFHAAGLPRPARLQVAGASVVRGMLHRGDVVGLGSPTGPALHTPNLVRRSVVERPRRTCSLIVDPAVVPGALAEQLATLLTARYLERFAEHHQDMLRDPWWAQWYGEQLDRQDAGTAHHSTEPSPASPPTDSGRLDVEDLHLLRAVAQHGSINRAAAVLSISQSALTRRIHRLEFRLGARLLLRSSRGTSLTSSTRKFLRQLDSFEREFHGAGTAARRHPGRVGHPGRPAPQSRWTKAG
ncbi:LysR family transcriptional regulator [Streptomyces finlayi]|uniref:LysR family transcriptional regulator n=1 Tax=Streptomyces finlayi TaxID=67296 RepID=A0A7G7BVI2_9ACTN|nr:LysR family transcriptional regulator [Streptomyces finlayi]